MATPTILSAVTDDSPRARATDPTTSHEAADSISAAALEDSEREVLAIIRGASRPLCAQEIEKAHERRRWATQPYGLSRIRTAFKQLRDAGVLIESGSTKTTSGCTAKTYTLAPTSERAMTRRLAVYRQKRLAEKADRDRARRSHHAPLRAA